MDLQQLRYFVTVAEYLNFTEAAKHLFVTQPGLSKQIADLEKFLGIELFIRNKRSVRLTPAGAEFLKEARDILSRSDEAILKARQIASGKTGKLRIGFVGALEQDFLSQLAKRFCSRFPQVELTLSKLNLGPINNALKNGDLDIGFTLSVGLENMPEFAWETIASDCLALVVPLDHPLANVKEIDLSLLANESFLTMDRDESPLTFEHIMRLCSNHGFSPRIVLQPPQWETLLLMVEAGRGVSLLLSRVENVASRNLRFVPIKSNDVRIDLVAAWNKTNSNSSIPMFLAEQKDGFLS